MDIREALQEDSKKTIWSRSDGVNLRCSQVSGRIDLRGIPGSPDGFKKIIIVDYRLINVKSTISSER